MAQLWSQSDTQTLRVLWAEGKSTTAIAKAIGNGLTRSAIAGRIRRLSLNRGRKTKDEDQPWKVSKPKLDFTKAHYDPQAVKAPEVIAEEEVPNTGWTLLTVGYRQCKWIFGAPSADAPVCGQPAKGPYCIDHSKRAYQSLKKP